MKKLCVFIAAVLVILLLSATAFAADGDGASNRIPRVVSIVFDDSGSMYKNTDRWAYTSYAMQTFTAMMGSEDTLFVTYLNNVVEKDEDKAVDLKSDKQKSINGFYSTLFGGGTPNRIKDGVDKLAEEYKNRQDKDAKYYLVVMADGELDDGSFSSKLPDIVSTAKFGEDKVKGEGEKGVLEDADFEAIYFSMASDEKIDGVECYYAATGTEIIERLKEISADIMGRTDVSDTCTMTDGVITVTLPYPSHSITLFAQKIDPKSGDNDTDEAVFNNINIPVAGCNSDTYYVKCPENVEDNINYSKIVWTGGEPDVHLGGFVTLITFKNDNPKEIPIIPKGEYKLDVSKYNLDMNNVIILLEPAVKMTCKYAVGDSENYRTFSEIKDGLRIGDSVTVKCGLYELNSDGTTGDEVSSDILPAKYEFFVNDLPVDAKNLENINDKNLYSLEISEEYAEKELRIKATLDNYKPSETKESFGKLSMKPEFDASKDFESEKTVTKLDLKELLSSKITVEYPLKHADSQMLNNIEIAVDGCEEFKSGVCSSLSDCVKIKGNSIIYTLVPKNKNLSFSSLPGEFKISLIDSFADAVLAEVKVKVIQPKYKFEKSNGLEGKTLSTALLENNKEKISFTLVADYNASGNYTETDEYDFKTCVKDLKLEKGGFSGEEKKSGAEISFVPVYKGSEKDDFFSKSHVVYASATVDGKTVKSDELEFSVNKPKYKLEAQNGITSSLTLSTLRSNTEKITFVLLADYDGDGSYEPLSEKDIKEIENIKIDAKGFPGKTETEYDDDKKPAGKSFTPFYDEKKDKNTELSALAGKHTISAELEKYGLSDKAEINIDKASYRFEINNEITDALSPDALKENERKIIFTVVADYEGEGKSFGPLADWDSAVYDGVKINSGKLCGKTKKELDSEGNIIGISFTPFYDEKEEKASLGSFVGKKYEISASCEEKGIKSEKVSISVGEIKYKVNVENPITAPLTLYTIKDNTQKVIFTVTADYEGTGKYTELADWDKGVYERLTVKNGNLPGNVATERDNNGNPVGKSFTPVYDKDNSEIAFTVVAGHTHVVEACIEDTKYSAKTEIKVEPPVYAIEVIKDGLELVDVKLRKNEERILFKISCNDHVLNADEVAGLAPYDIVLSKNSDSMIIAAEPAPNADGTAYLSCKPTYNGWTFIHPVLWNWQSLYRVRDGDMQLTLTVANASAAANMYIDTDSFYFTVFLIILAILAVIAWFVFCFLTRMRFPSGTFYRATFIPDPRGKGWCVSTLERKKANAGRFGMFFRSRFFLPFAHQKKVLSLLDSDNKARFETVRSDDMLDFVSLPHWKTKDEFMYNTGCLDPSRILSIINEDPDVAFTKNEITGTPTARQPEYEISFKMDAGVFIGETGRTVEEKGIIFFLSNRTEREYRKLNNILNNTKRKKR